MRERALRAARLIGPAPAGPPVTTAKPPWRVLPRGCILGQAVQQHALLLPRRDYPGFLAFPHLLADNTMGKSQFPTQLLHTQTHLTLPQWESQTPAVLELGRI